MEKKNQIFFLHFAGGSCQSYNFLAKKLSEFEIHQLELPGRGRRTFDPFIEDIEEAAKDYTVQIRERLNGKLFIIYGHSMGALVGIYVAKKLEGLGERAQQLIVSGNSGPGVEQDKKRHLLEGDEFLSELRVIGGMPDTFFEDEDLVDYFSPILKADFKLVEENSAKIPPPINAPIVSLMGNQDPNCKHILNWKKFTTSGFQSKAFDGGHFFIHDNVDEIVEIIKNSFKKQPVLLSSVKSKRA